MRVVATVAGSRRSSKLGAACVKICNVSYCSVCYNYSFSLTALENSPVYSFIFSLSFSLTLYFYPICPCLSLSLCFHLHHSCNPPPPSLFQHMHLFYKSHDCPFHENQKPWHTRAPVFKSCLASGRQSPPGCLPSLSAVVEIRF